MSREFFSVRRVSEAREGFRPARRTPAESVPLARAAGRVPVHDLRSPCDLPGFVRATVDGFAVRARDTHGASEGLPAYLRVVGAVRMGAPAGVVVPEGGAVDIPTGGALPAGADAVVMVEHTAPSTPGDIEVTRPAAAGEGIVSADEDVARGAVLAAAGRPLRAQDIGVLAAAGVCEVAVARRPRVAIVSTGDEVVPPQTAGLLPGQVRDAIAPALAALVAEAGGLADPRGIVPDDPAALAAALSAAVTESDLVVVSAGSSVGARDATGEVVSGLGEPGVWCHGLAVKPGKPTILAMAGDVPVIGLPGNPLSALVIFRLLGMPLVRDLAGWVHPITPRTARARLGCDLPSIPGRLDVVQVRLDDGAAEPLFGTSALLALLARADGFVRVEEDMSGLYEGSEVEVELYS